MSRIPNFLGWIRKRSRRSSRRASIPYEGLAYVVILIVLLWGALLGHSNMLLLVFAMMAGPWIVNGALCYNLLRKIDIRRHAPSRVMAGEPFSVELTITNARRYFSSWVLTASDRLQHAGEQLAPSVLFTRVPPHSERSVPYQACLMQRGVYRFGPIRISTQFPLGLAERVLVIQEVGEILVYPQLGQLSPLWRRQTRRADELVQQARSRRGHFDDEFHRLREYRPGDDPRSIHWRTSARQNELMVREYHQSRADDLTVLLDPWIPWNPSAEDMSRVELAISFAATIGFEHCMEARGSTLEISVISPEQEQWQGIAGPYSIDPYLEKLALVEASESADLENCLEQVVSQRRTHGRFVLITSRRMQANQDRGRGHEEEGNGWRWSRIAKHAASAQQLIDLVQNLSVGQSQPHMELIEADPRQLADMFQLHPRSG